MQLSLPHYLLILTPLVISVGQICFKIISRSADFSTKSSVLSLLIDPLFIVAILLYAAGTLMWIYALRHFPLIFAYPFMALSFMIVPLLSLIFLGERLNYTYFVGIFLIVSGLLIVVKSASRTFG